MNQHHSLITCTWDALSVNANQTKVLWKNTRTCSRQVYLLEQPKIYQDATKNHTKTAAWSYDMKGHAEKCAERCCERQSNRTKFQVFAFMTVTLRRRNLKQWENCRKCAHKLYKNACTWHELAGQTFYGQWTNLLDQSQNGQKFVTED